MSNLPISPVVELKIPDEVMAREGFETAPPYAFTTSNGGTSNWAPSTNLPYYGSKSLETPTLVNGQQCDFNMTAPAGTTKVRLWYYFDAGASDLLRIYVNGVNRKEVVASSDWTQFEYPVAAGQIVQLKYIRNVGGGGNVGYVDDVQFLADGWVDITEDVRLTAAHSGGGISIKRGRPNESPIAEPTECDIVINNSAGKWSELNPAGPYFGRLGRNQPFRVSLARRRDEFARTLSNQWGSMPNWTDTENVSHAGTAWTLVGTAANFDVTPGAATVQSATGTFIAYTGTYADVDVKVRVKVSTRDTEFGIMLRTNGTEQIRAYITPGTTDKAQIARVGTINGWAFSTNLASNIVADTWYWMRAQITGLRYRMKFWADGEVEQTAWTRTYTDDRIVEADGTVPSTGGAGVWVRNGTGLVTYSEFETNLWRAHTEVVSFPIKFDLSRRDQWVPLKTRGILRRLGQGRKDLSSALTGHLNQYSATSAMWYTLESVEGSTVSNAIPTGRAGQISGYSVESPDLTGTSALPGVSGMVHLTEDTSYFIGYAPNYDSSARAWTVVMFFQIDAVVASTQLLATYTATGTGRTFKLYLQNDGQFKMDVIAADGVTVLSTNTAAGIGIDQLPPGCWVSSELYVFDSGGTVTWAWNYHRPEPGFDFYTLNGTFSGGAGQFRSITVRGNSVWTAAGGLRLAQVFHYPGDFPFVNIEFADAAAAYRTETNVDRFGRLCNDGGIPYSLVGQSGDGHQMGAQLPGKRLDLLQDCTTVGDYVLEEDRDDFGLVIRTRQSIYNGDPLVLDVDQGHLSDPLDPAPDDQATRNDVIVNRPEGGFGRSIQATGPLNINDPEDDPDGVGTYDEQVTHNFYQDSQLQSAAEWRRAKGTQRVPRYPSLPIDLTAEAYDSDPAATALALQIDSGRLLQVVNPELGPDPLMQVVQSYTEDIDQYDHDLQVVATPAQPYIVGVSGYTTRVSPSGLVLAAPYVVGTDTTLKTRPINSSYSDWVPTATDPDVDNFDIMVGGVRLTVTNVGSPTLSITTLTVNATPANAVDTGFTLQPGLAIALADPWITAWEGS